MKGVIEIDANFGNLLILFLSFVSQFSVLKSSSSICRLPIISPISLKQGKTFFPFLFVHSFH